MSDPTLRKRTIEKTIEEYAPVTEHPEAEPFAEEQEIYNDDPGVTETDSSDDFESSDEEG